MEVSTYNLMRDSIQEVNRIAPKSHALVIPQSTTQEGYELHSILGHYNLNKVYRINDLVR